MRAEESNPIKFSGANRSCLETTCVFRNLKVQKNPASKFVFHANRRTKDLVAHIETPLEDRVQRGELLQTSSGDLTVVLSSHKRNQWGYALDRDQRDSAKMAAEEEEQILDLLRQIEVGPSKSYLRSVMLFRVNQMSPRVNGLCLIQTP